MTFSKTMILLICLLVIKQTHKMMRLVALSALVVVVFGDVSHLVNRNRYQQGGVGAEIPILRQEASINPDGSYQWAYETGNGIAAQEQGSVRQVDKDLATQAQGSYGYTSPEGEQVSVSYVADENGFQVQGSHLPVPPPIPDQIVRALEWIAAHPEKEEPSRRF